jgi:phosphoglycerate dehydrogenase-like enzyme
MKILIYPAVEPERLAKIKAAAEPAVVVNAADEARAIAEAADADGFFGKITPPILAAAKRLCWVQTPTASLEHYLFPELVEHPCVLTNMRGLFGDVIADHVFGYMLCFARNFPTYWRNQQHAKWEPVGGEAARTSNAAGAGISTAIDFAHTRLADCTLGIVGMGHIGREIARRGVAFGMRVLGVDPVAREAPPGVEAVWDVGRLEELLGESDFVVIAAPHTSQTACMFGRKQFAQMKRTAYLINIGRGVIVKLAELVEALQDKIIAGAGLDVFEIEPLPADHPLWRMPNVTLTPHVAAASPRIAERHLATLLENVRRFVRGEELLNVADKRRWF